MDFFEILLAFITFGTFVTSIVFLILALIDKIRGYEAMPRLKNAGIYLGVSIISFIAFCIVIPSPSEDKTAETQEVEEVAEPTTSEDESVTEEQPQEKPVTKKSLVRAVKKTIQDDVDTSKGEKITDVQLNDKDLCVYVDFSEADTAPLSKQDVAIARVSAITDNILGLDEKYDELWDTISVDFGSLGKVTCTKDMIADDGYGRYFDPTKDPSGDFNFVGSTEDNSSEQTDTDIDSQLDGYIVLANSILKENFGENNYSVSRDGKTITISVWREGVALGAAYAATGNAETKDSWQTMLDGIQSMSQSMYGSLKDIGIEDGHLIVNVVNDANTDNVLATFLDGTLIYDAVNDESTTEKEPIQNTVEPTNIATNGENYNFDTYNIPEQQQTTAQYVLNNNTMKFHHPSCSSVAKIKPENYAVSNDSRETLISQGYDPCGICNP